MIFNQDSNQKQASHPTRNLVFFPNEKTENFYSEFDLLTGLYNKYGFLKQMGEHLDNPDNSGGLLLLFDIDHLKKINIVHGRLTGDNILKLLADLLKGQKEDGDILCRLNKDKFALALTNKNLKEAYAKASKIQKIVSKLKIIANDKVVNINVFMTALPYIRENTGQELLSMAGSLIEGQKKRHNERTQIPAFLG